MLTGLIEARRCIKATYEVTQGTWGKEPQENWARGVQAGLRMALHNIDFLEAQEAQRLGKHIKL